jgi:fructose-1,6-bisphosphatase I
LKNGGESLCAILSEEEEDIIHTGNNHGKYVVAMDPLDGSSNIDVNVSIGIDLLHLQKGNTRSTEPASMEDFLQGGRKQIAAGYILVRLVDNAGLFDRRWRKRFYIRSVIR